MSIAQRLSALKAEIAQHAAHCELIAVSKTHPVVAIEAAYQAGQRHFGENKAQEMAEKQAQLPPDIRWHMIGHLQRNKVKYITPFVHLIHSVDSVKLLEEINKQAQKNGRIIDCLLQLHIAAEETKFGLDFDEARALLTSPELATLTHIRIVGLMGMATNTDNEAQITTEFQGLKQFFDQQAARTDLPDNVALSEISMGMSGDYLLGIAQGSTMVRIGSAIFGQRDYA
ncbi:YggS family pyridoxal phosphate-dependent enzyme [Eisenibacter elegans]|jgi:pyridoxal phosphate enzyme (YggS family)|uniref:YggS family pyridoxal phosphate-dependent enzyme n=1 Tax=Eisenibacter elegans TaxID=997 RepID=UPI000421742F|nr:YggS family pyridoxal phosphate-dependent enzyme [Eisenibacter elegans]